MISFMEARKVRTRSRAGAARAVLLFLALALSQVPAVHAGAPTEKVRGAIDRTIEILKTPELSPPERREERRGILRGEIGPIFDFGEMAKRSLARNWRGRTPEERREFVALFREIIENSYLVKIEAYQGEKTAYVGETVDFPYAEVNTKIVTVKGQEFSVDYRMRENGGDWRVYDVVIEGISLVNNYRSQFNSILQKSSYAEMIEKLRATARKSGE